MATRLDRQRQPGRYHKRFNNRLYRRGYTDLPHIVWGDRWTPAGGGGGTIPPGPGPGVGRWLIGIGGTPANPGEFAWTTGDNGEKIVLNNVDSLGNLTADALLGLVGSTIVLVQDDGQTFTFPAAMVGDARPMFDFVEIESETVSGGPIIDQGKPINIYGPVP